MKLTLTLSDGATASVEYLGQDWDRCLYRWALGDPDGSIVASGDDLRSGSGDDVDLPGMLATLATFVSAFAEARSYADSENYNLFPESAVEWAMAYSDEFVSITEAWEE